MRRRRIASPLGEAGENQRFLTDEGNVVFFYPLIRPFGVPINSGMIATGNHCNFRFAARSTTPEGKVFSKVNSDLVY